MKILNVVRFFPKLSETFVLDQLTRQVKSGFDVQIAAMTDPRKHLALEDRELEKEIHSDVIENRLLEKTTYLDFSQPGMIDSIVEQTRPDIIHIHFGDLAPRIIDNNRLKNIPIVVSFFGVVMPASSDSRALSFQDYSSTFRRADLLTTHSLKWKKDIERMGADSKKTIQFVVGVDLDFWSQNNLGRTTGKPFLCSSVGRLVEKKGLHHLLNAINIIQGQSTNDLNYVIIGDGVEFDKLEKIRQGLREPQKVTFLGKKDRNQIKQTLAETDLFIAPSVTAGDGDEEGVPTTLMEAAAMGLPIITTKHGGIPDFFIDEKNALLLDEHDEESLARSITRCYKDSELRNKLGREAKDLARISFDGEKLSKVMFNHYQKLINSYENKSTY